ncbi:response regulator [Paenibacillus sp. PR3]|uniref:Response regulator n=1 Tax=Paenibacillus terricola TaxID=2763503 RepID=A0ABR8N6L4_9BACL|nr:response regulator [Paenibacillus terricola]MBD3922484.1 response regulator [Paenibacillus terricola]
MTIRTIVAEDEELILRNLVKKIQAVDPIFEIIDTATDGETALQLLDRSPIDLLITDIHMPVIDGLELIRQTHLKHPNIHKVIISGYNDFEYARHALKHEVVDYLLKPVKPSELDLVLGKIKIKMSQEQEARGAAKAAKLDNHTYTPEEIVQSVQLFLKNNYAKELNLEEIAREYNFNSSYLTKIFIKHAGEPPSKYLIRLRISEAKRLLDQEKSWSIKEVGERVGYADPYYFSRMFKQATGMTPSEYRGKSG